LSDNLDCREIHPVPDDIRGGPDAFAVEGYSSTTSIWE